MQLQMRLGVFSQNRTRYPLQRNVHAVREVFEAFRQVSQPGAGRGQVRGVDLRQVAQAHHFGTGAGTGDDGFHLVRCEVFIGLKEMFPFENSKGYPGRVKVYFNGIIEPTASPKDSKAEAYQVIKKTLIEHSI